MVVLIIFPVILQTVINVIMLSIGGQGTISIKKTYQSYLCYIKIQSEIYTVGNFVK